MLATGHCLWTIAAWKIFANFSTESTEMILCTGMSTCVAVGGPYVLRAATNAGSALLKLRDIAMILNDPFTSNMIASRLLVLLDEATQSGRVAHVRAEADGRRCKK